MTIQNESEKVPSKGRFCRFIQFCFCTLPKALLGTWSPPVWLRSIWRLLTTIYSKTIGRPLGFLWGIASRHKRKAILITLLVVGSLVARDIYQYWLHSKPGAPWITLSVENPRPTALDGKNDYQGLNVRLSQAGAPLTLVGKEVVAGISWTPNIQGTWKWTSDSLLHFQPSEDWRTDQEYTLQFLKSVFSPQIRIEKLTYEVETERFNPHLTNTIFYQDPSDPKVKKLVATMRFNYRVDRSSLEKRIGIVRIEPRPGVIPDIETPVGFSVRYDEHGREAYIHSDVIPIEREERKLRLVIDKGVLAASGGRETQEELQGSVNVPSIYSFFKAKRVNARWVDDENDQPRLVLLLQLSDGASKQDIDNKIEITVLPVDRPAQEGRKLIPNHHWSGAKDISPTDLAAGTRLTSLKADLPAKRYVKQHSFPLKVAPKRRLFVRLKKGLKSESGYVLPEDSEWVIHVPNLSIRLDIAHNGGILALRGERSLAVVSRGLKEIKMTLGRVINTEVNHLITQTNGDLNDLSFPYHKFNQNNISEVFTTERAVKLVSKTEPQYTSIDFNRYVSSPDGPRAGLFFVRLQGKAPDERTVHAKRFLLLTDLGMITKQNTQGGWDVFVQSLSTGKPVSSAKVVVLAANGRPRAQGVTGPQGHLYFKKVKGRGSEHPIAFVATKGQDLSFLPFDRYQRRLNLSRFDVGGVRGRSDKDELTAFTFSDRGIYRPGEYVQIAAIARSRQLDRNVQGVLIRTRIKDSKGRTIHLHDHKLPAGGLIEFGTSTKQSSPTGTYVASVHLLERHKGKLRQSRHLGTTTVRVEEFVPDRMKIRARLSASRNNGWVKPDDLSATVTLENLFGAPATDRRVRGRVTITPANASFRGHDGFRFHTPLESGTRRSFAQDLDDLTTNAGGDATFDLDLSHAASGLWRISFDAEGFEASGGRSVTTSVGTLVSPLDTLIGIKTDGSLGYLKKKSERNIEIIAVDGALAKVAKKGIELVLEEEQYVSVLTERSNGTMAYQSERRVVEIKRSSFNISSQGQKYALETQKPGNFILSLREGQQVLANLRYHVVGKANLTRQMEKSAELELKLDKSDYEVEDEIEVSIKGPYRGAGLITIEGDEVHAFKWFDATTTATVETIRIPRGVEGNAYVQVALLRDANSPEVFTSPLSYGVMPFSLSKKARTVLLTIDRPERVRPGEDLVVKVRADRKAKAIIFGVDEGILQVAGYKTPNPIEHFFKKRALQVTTWQLLDLLLPEASISKEMSASGGGMDESEDEGANLNPFQRKVKKPIAFWSGVVDVSDQETEHRFKLPDDFNGAMRLMAVTSSRTAIGAIEETVRVRGDIILTPNAPLFAAPGDRFRVTVGVSNQIEGSGDTPTQIAVKALPSEHLTIEGETSVSVDVAQAREGKAIFEVTVQDRLGGAEIQFVANAKGLKSGMRADKGKGSVTLSVRPAAPFLTTLTTGHVTKDSAWLPLDRELYPHLATREIQFGTIPITVAKGLYRYVENFPFECTEQLVSRSVAGMMLHDVKGIGVNRTNAQQSFNRTMQALRLRQTNSGAFGVWAANANTRPHHTIYASHFLLEAKERGWPIGEDVIQRALGYVITFIGKEAKTMSDARLQSYALYVLARSGKVVTPQLDLLVAHVQQAWPKEWQKDLFSVWAAGTYSLLQKASQAQEFIGERDFGLGEKNSIYFTDPLSSDMQLLYVTAKHFPDDLERLVDAKGLNRLIKPITENRYNSLSSAYSIMGLRAYVDAIGRVGSERKTPESAISMPFGLDRIKLGGGETAVVLQEAYTQDQKNKGSTKGLPIHDGLFPTTVYSEKAKALSVQSRLSQPLFYQVTHAGFDKRPPKEAMTDKIEITREYRKGSSVVSTANVGDELTVHIMVRTVGKQGTVHDVALVDLLPSGFEIDRESARTSLPTQGTPSLTPEFVDLREDRALIFASISSSTASYAYKVKVTAPGSFVVPPPQAMSLYDLTLRGRGPSAQFEVSAP